MFLFPQRPVSKEAYRKLAMKFHPDKNRGKGARQAEETFRKISRAHEARGKGFAHLREARRVVET